MTQNYLAIVVLQGIRVLMNVPAQSFSPISPAITGTTFATGKMYYEHAISTTVTSEMLKSKPDSSNWW